MGCIVANVKKILYICGVNLIIDVIVSSYLIVKSNQFTESCLSNNFGGLNHFNIMQRKL